jgi:lipopolysaccharide/colanic/teichoic acid biosynthesis glycosyltransferase
MQWIRLAATASLWFILYVLLLSMGLLGVVDSLSAPIDSTMPLLPSLLAVVLAPCVFALTMWLSRAALLFKQHPYQPLVELVVVAGVLWTIVSVVIAPASYVERSEVNQPVWYALGVTACLAVMGLVMFIAAALRTEDEPLCSRPGDPATSSAQAHRAEVGEEILDQWRLKLASPLFGAERRRRRGELLQMAESQPEIAAELWTRLSHEERPVMENALLLLQEIQTAPQAYSLLQPFFQCLEARSGELRNEDAAVWLEASDGLKLFIRHARELAKNRPPIVARLGKRAFDVLVSLVGLSIFAMVFPIIYVAIKSESGRNYPVFFSFRALGRDGREFEYIRFNTSAIRSSKRISIMGEFLVISGLDRWPALWNVLRGSMSIVGPAPVYYYLLLHKGEQMYRRLLIKPGLVSRAQLEASVAPHTCEEYIDMDLDYVRTALTGRRLLRRDLKLVALAAGRLAAVWVFAPTRPDLGDEGWILLHAPA